MPKGEHSSIRVALAVPPKLHEQLKAWAEYEGRPVASLCMYLIEHSLRQAQRDGLAPSYGNEETDKIDKVEPGPIPSPATTVPRFLGHRYETTARQESGQRSLGRDDKRFTQMYEDKLAAKKLEEEKKEKLFQLLQELTDSQ
jgi:hypothetical protein